MKNLCLLTKSEAMLFMHDKLQTDSFIKRSQIEELLGISELTFRRYVVGIRRYYQKMRPDLDIVYNKKKDTYELYRYEHVAPTFIFAHEKNDKADSKDDDKETKQGFYTF